MAIIKVEDLVKRYGDRAVVDRVGFAVEQGEIFDVLGWAVICGGLAARYFRWE